MWVRLSTIIGIALAGVVLVTVGARAIQQLPRLWSASHWPSTQGVIERHVLEKRLNPKQTSVYITPRPNYLYAVDGRLYKGTSRYLGDNGSAGPETFGQTESTEAALSLRDYPPGKRVTVYYNPDNHRDAVLDREDRRFWALEGGIVVFVLLVGAALLYLAFRARPLDGVVVVVLVLAWWWNGVPAYEGDAYSMPGDPSLVETFQADSATPGFPPSR